MTKNEEIAALQNFAASLPVETYLRDILAEVAPLIENAIRSDLGFIPLGELWRDKVQMHEENTAARKANQEQIARLQAEVKDLEKRAARAKADLEEIRNTAARLCRV
jgi:hypothetical protein